MSHLPPIKVALWAPVPPPMGGIGGWTLRYVSAAAQFGLDAKVINISPQPGSFTERSAFRVDRLAPATRALRELAMVLRRDRPAVVHVTTTLFWATPRDAAALALAKSLGIPTVLHIRASTQIIQWHKQLPYLQRIGVDHCLRLASSILVLSRELQDYLEVALPGQRIDRIGNMIEFAGARDLPLVLPPRNHAMRVLFVGAITPLKGVGELCRAILTLPNVELVIVGEAGGAMDAEAKTEMLAAIEALRATGRLHQTGQLAPEMCSRAYLEVDIFALPSHREGMPNVLLEAMAAALPCVVTPVGAIPDMIQGDLALSVPVDDADALAVAINRLVHDAELRRTLGQRGQTAVMAAYSVPAVMLQYRDLYLDLMRI